MNDREKDYQIEWLREYYVRSDVCTLESFEEAVWQILTDKPCKFIIPDPRLIYRIER